MNNPISEEKIVLLVPESPKPNNEVIHLEKYWFNKDIDFEEGNDIEGKAELLINYHKKLLQAQEKVEYFKRCIDALTNELPEDMYIKSSNGVIYYIQRKVTDKELIPYISECECCQEKDNDRSE